MFIFNFVSTIVYLAVVPFFSPVVNSVHYIRVSAMVALICLTIGTFLSVECVDIYHSLFNDSSSTTIEAFFSFLL